jgi:hypothetical protein
MLIPARVLAVAQTGAAGVAPMPQIQPVRQTQPQRFASAMKIAFYCTFDPQNDELSFSAFRGRAVQPSGQPWCGD